MSGLEYAKALYGYNEWANGHVLEAAAGVSEEDLDNKLGASFDSVRGNLVHTCGAQVLWLSRWTGEKSEAYPLLAGEPPLETIRRAFAISHVDLKAFVDSLSEDDLERGVRYRDTRGENQEGVLWRMMLQVANHGTHHRAETALLLTQLGSAPRQLDYLFFEIERAGGKPRLT